jgi:hypothetical protein
VERILLIISYLSLLVVMKSAHLVPASVSLVSLFLIVSAVLTFAYSIYDISRSTQIVQYLSPIIRGSRLTQVSGLFRTSGLAQGIRLLRILRLIQNSGVVQLSRMMQTSRRVINRGFELSALLRQVPVKIGRSALATLWGASRAVTMTLKSTKQLFVQVLVKCFNFIREKSNENRRQTAVKRRAKVQRLALAKLEAEITARDLARAANLAAERRREQDKSANVAAAEAAKVVAAEVAKTVSKVENQAKIRISFGAKVKGNLFVIRWLMHRNQHLKAVNESLLAEVHELNAELKTIVDVWTPQRSKARSIAFGPRKLEQKHDQKPEQNQDQNYDQDSSQNHDKSQKLDIGMNIDFSESNEIARVSPVLRQPEIDQVF